MGGNPVSLVDPLGLSGVIPKNYGKNKPINPVPNPTKDSREKTDKIADWPIGDHGIRCALGLGGCPTDDPNLYICKKCGARLSAVDHMMFQAQMELTLRFQTRQPLVCALKKGSIRIIEVTIIPLGYK